MGRTSILLVIGFNLIFMSMGFNLSQVSSNAYQNYLDYYDRTVADQIAASAANMASEELTMNPGWNYGFHDISFQGGTYRASVTKLDSGRIQMTATSTFNSVSSSIVVVLGVSRFSRFSYYSNIEGAIYWITGDTVRGPFHTQQKINVSGSPVFVGKATSKNGLYKNPPSSTPRFLGGYQSGVSIDLPANLGSLSMAANTGGKKWTQTPGHDVFFSFDGKGYVTISTDSWTNSPVKCRIDSISPNGVFLVDGANVHVKGSLGGLPNRPDSLNCKVTVAATGSSGASKGNIYIDSSIAYNHDPAKGPSNEYLGLVCDNDVIVSHNSNNNTADGVTIQASIFARSGGLTAEDYDTRPPSGTLRLLGGVQQYQRGPVGTFSGNTILHGFHKNYQYDNRLMVDSPPFYPPTGNFEVLSWYE